MKYEKLGAAKPSNATLKVIRPYLTWQTAQARHPRSNVLGTRTSSRTGSCISDSRTRLRPALGTKDGRSSTNVEKSSLWEFGEQPRFLEDSSDSSEETGRLRQLRSTARHSGSIGV
jgi:hypothetical protein